jgi:hypothetical protein
VCEYCEKETVIFEQNHMGLDGPWTFDSEAKATRKDYEAFEYRQGVFIDSRGYLRMADMDDCQCLDHGHNLKIFFCPVCGRDMRAIPAEGTTRDKDQEWLDKRGYVKNVGNNPPIVNQALAHESTGGKA